MILDRGAKLPLTNRLVSKATSILLAILMALFSFGTVTLASPKFDSDHYTLSSSVENKAIFVGDAIDIRGSLIYDDGETREGVPYAEITLVAYADGDTNRDWVGPVIADGNGDFFFSGFDNLPAGEYYIELEALVDINGGIQWADDDFLRVEVLEPVKKSGYWNTHVTSDGVYGGVTSISAWLFDSDKNPIAGKDVVVEANGQQLPKTTSNYGHTQFSITKNSDFGLGSHTVTWIAVVDGEEIKEDVTFEIDKKPNLKIRVGEQTKTSLYELINFSATFEVDFGDHKIYNLVGDDQIDLVYSVNNDVEPNTCEINATVDTKGSNGTIAARYNITDIYWGQMYLYGDATCVLEAYPPYFNGATVDIDEKEELQFGDDIPLAIRVLDGEGDPVSDVEVTFEIDGVTPETVDTGSDGWARVTFAGSNKLDAGIHTAEITASVQGFNLSDEIDIGLTERDLHITVHDKAKANKYDTVEFTSTITGLANGDTLDPEYYVVNGDILEDEEYEGLCAIVFGLAVDGGAKLSNYKVNGKPGVLTLPSDGACVVEQARPYFGVTTALGENGDIFYGDAFALYANLNDTEYDSSGVGRPTIIVGETVTFKLTNMGFRTTVTATTNEYGTAEADFTGTIVPAGVYTVEASATVDGYEVTKEFSFTVERLTLTVDVADKSKTDRYGTVDFEATFSGLLESDEDNLGYAFSVYWDEDYDMCAITVVMSVSGNVNPQNYDLVVLPGELTVPDGAACTAKENPPSTGDGGNNTPPPPVQPVTPGGPAVIEPTNPPVFNPLSTWALEALDIVRNNTNLAEFFGEDAPLNVGGTELGSIIAALASLHGLEDVPGLQPPSTTPSREDGRPVTRAQAAKAIYDVLSALRPVAVPPNEHQHVWQDEIDAGMLNIINILTDLGIVKGYPDGTFRPDVLVSREEMAALVVRLMALLEQQ